MKTKVIIQLMLFLKLLELGGNPSSFLPTVNVFVGDSEGIDDFNQYIDDVIENLKMHYVDFSLDNKEVNDDNSAILVYNGSLGGYNVKCKQLIGVKGDKLYIATYVSEKKVLTNIWKLLIKL